MLTRPTDTTCNGKIWSSAPAVISARTRLLRPANGKHPTFDQDLRFETLHLVQAEPRLLVVMRLAGIRYDLVSNPQARSWAGARGEHSSEQSQHE